MKCLGEIRGEGRSFKNIKVWRKSEHVLQLQGIFEKVGVDYYYEAEAWQSPWKNASCFYI